MRPPICCGRALVWVSVLALGLAASCAAGAVTASRESSLKVAVPTSMQRGSVLALTASGYSGQYDEVAFSTVEGGGSTCRPPGADTIGMQAVAKQHAFNVRFTNIFGGPGALTVCVYLFTSGPHANISKGHYIVKSGHVKVS